ncbi:4'-phosphopantetheinyl transferase superfamily protein [Pseudoduganella sp. SL102]|uniref:4'-phosphopantetheinyl transferase family protein n=1 Tax=Pseudoduganella sp. SL102 TaxID=2995154 RepID=UPI00248B17DB|nr:4'-phosphopantetheinyl transferase superfamily protein [Pseudoduganella sp. SL102]WBS03484.1 4'-phosphopantetheinyl transferase superfamily protein [Pseudoduganella sp. SL102]
MKNLRLPDDEPLLVWVRTADVAAALPQAQGWLTPAERERARRFVFDGDRADFLASRFLLRRVLAELADTEPERLLFDTSRHGKPALRGRPDLAFNLSHCRGVAVLLIGAGAAAGVDIELVQPGRADPLVAQRLFHRAEQIQLLACPRGGYDRLFLRFWTLKEAVLKAEGSGLALPMDAFAALIDGDSIVPLTVPLALAGRPFAIGQVELAPDLVCAWTRVCADRQVPTTWQLGAGGTVYPAPQVRLGTGSHRPRLAAGQPPGRRKAALAALAQGG